MILWFFFFFGKFDRSRQMLKGKIQSLPPSNYFNNLYHELDIFHCASILILCAIPLIHSILLIILKHKETNMD